jgi:hypothetical protein
MTEAWLEYLLEPKLLEKLVISNEIKNRLKILTTNKFMTQRQANLSKLFLKKRILFHRSRHLIEKVI